MMWRLYFSCLNHLQQHLSTWEIVDEVDDDDYPDGRRSMGKL